MAYTKNSEGIRSFLGFGNFYQWFIKNFSHLAQPLNNLLKKDKKFIWSNECQESFDLLKKRFTEEPVLMMLDHTRPFQIQVNSSLFATRGILTQMHTNGDRHPCAYLSKSLTKEQRNYDTGDRIIGNSAHTKRMAALYSGIRTHNHYLI